jgi:hypothetical protein
MTTPKTSVEEKVQITENRTSLDLTLRHTGSIVMTVAVAAALQRIPELEAAPEARGAPVSTSEDAGNGMGRESQDGQHLTFIGTRPASCCRDSLPPSRELPLDEDRGGGVC